MKLLLRHAIRTLELIDRNYRLNSSPEAVSALSIAVRVFRHHLEHCSFYLFLKIRAKNQPSNVQISVYVFREIVILASAFSKNSQRVLH